MPPILVPYVTPAMLIEAPTGIAWSSIPRANATDEQKLAAQINICNRVSSIIDGLCYQRLRATVDVESLLGPDFRITVSPSTGLATVILSRTPILSVVSAQASPASAIPPSWFTIPANAMLVENIDIASSLVAISPDGAGSGNATVVIAPGYIDWSGGRKGWRLQMTYVNGWPHCGLTADADEDDTTLHVTDCTGWAGQQATLFDGENTEYSTVLSATAAAGPGTVTLGSPLLYAHPAGVLLTTMPASVQQAGILLAVIQALTRGSSAVVAQSMGAGQSSNSRVKDLKDEANALLAPFRRVI